MKQDFYILANQIDSSGEAAACAEERLDDWTGQKYRHDVLAAIHREKSRKRGKRIVAAAAVMAVLAAGSAVFYDEVQAAIEQIHLSLGEALGLESAYAARYTKVVHTSVSSAGYTITLDEVIAAPMRLYMVFYIERKDGRPMKDVMQILEQLSINGREVDAGGGIGMGFMDQEKKVLSVTVQHSLPDRMLSGENLYEIKLTSDDVKAGNWKFKFRADSSEIYKDTKVMPIGAKYVLEDGTKLILDELIINKMSQQIAYRLLGDYHEIKIFTVDEKGRKTVFEGGAYGDGNDRSYMENTFAVRKGELQRTWIADDAEKLEVKVYTVDAPEIDGINTDAYKKQIGKKAVWDLTKLESMGK